jgi:hypothetical protein
MAKKRGKQEPGSRLDDYSNAHAFHGELEFDLVLEFLGERCTKRCRAVYAFTPGDWSFYDIDTKTVRSEIESCIYHVDILAVPEVEQNEDGTWKLGAPYWVAFEDFIRDDILSHDMQDTILNAIDTKCRLEDTERRSAAGTGK